MITQRFPNLAMTSVKIWYGLHMWPNSLGDGSLTLCCGSDGTFKRWGPPMGTPKHHRSLPTLLVTLHNLRVKPHGWRQPLHTSSNTEQSSWCLTRSFTSTDEHSWSWKVLRMLLESSTAPCSKPCNLQQWPDCKIYCCNNSTNIMEITNHSLIGLKASTPWVGTYTWHGECGQELDTR